MDAFSGQHRLVYKAHTSPINDGSWSPDFTRIATASADSTVRIWDAATGETLLTHTFDSNVFGAAWSPDAKFIAAGAEHDQLQNLDTTSNTIGLAYSGNGYPVFRAGWSPTGTHIAGTAERLYVWDAHTGKILFSMPGGTTTFGWSPDGTRIASVADRPQPVGAAIVWLTS
ncbi:MAG TPA: hypothetical protein VF043_37025 [Ktedonobacteraceae bacterium]